jgi:hypothetical protein
MNTLGIEIDYLFDGSGDGQSSFGVGVESTAGDGEDLSAARIVEG